MSLIIKHDNISINVNKFIEDLLAVQHKPGKPVRMNLSDIMNLNHLIRKLIVSQPMLVDVNGPIKVCGDIHGQYYDLLRIFHMCGFPADDQNYLFLGDYVDRGRQSLECICLLFAYKLKYPNKVTLLRGNHESSQITKIYGFYDECKRRYNVKLWKTFIDTFNCLPIAAIIEDKIFCCHGGLSPEMMKESIENLESLKSLIRSINRPIDIPDKGLICDLLWSDPWYPELPIPEHFDNLRGWRLNERGVSFQFAPDVIDRFLSKYDLTLVMRAHQVVEDGYEFYANRSLVTLFSAPNYCGEFDNAAAVFILDKRTLNYVDGPSVNLIGSFRVLKPRIDVTKWSKLDAN